ncbi:MAG: guanylate kinase [Patescibacteria group bacterium]|nr:guanylate kinase [Patescibacteria group bacterium]
MKGKLVLLMGPSGSGKGALLSHARSMFPDLVYPTSWTTRLPREGEQDSKSASGKAYHFVSTEEFVNAKDQGVFLEWDHHFDNYYGTPAQEVRDALAAGRTVLQELEVQGVKQLLEKVPRDQTKIIFVMAGSWEDLSRRIRGRQSISEDELEKRHLRYEDEVRFMDKADYILKNEFGKLEETKQKFAELIRTIIKS